MKMTNNDIYTYAVKLNEAFSDTTQKLPVKINFYLQKNKSTLLSLAQSVEETRAELLQQYGTSTDDGGYTISEENVAIVNKEINDLAALEQEVNIYKVKFEDFPEDISLTTAQMEALMFMID